MGYMDSLSQGYQNTYGGYTQMYRKQPQTQIGGSQIKAPMRISLDRMYGGQPTALPTMAPAGQYPMSLPEDYQPTAGYDDYDAYLTEQGFEQYTDPVSGEELWRPANPEEGQIYQAPGDDPIIFEDGEWKDYSASRAAYESSGTLDIEALTGPQTPLSAPIHWLYQAVTTGGMGNLGEIYEYVRANMDESRTYGQWLQGMRDEIIGLMDTVDASPGILQKDAVKQQLTDIADGLLAETQRLQNIEASSENWQAQLETLMEQLSSGELDYLDEEGNLDVTALIESGNVMGQWMADVLETSYETGMIQSDFFDEEGNLVPELQAMSDYFTNDPEAREAWDKYNKQLALHAIASGQSVESAYYTEATANAVAGYGAQVAGQVTTLLQNEMKMQYEYIVNSFKTAMEEAAGDYATEEFVSQMNDAYEAIQQQYEMAMEQLADAIAEGQMGTVGNIFSGALSFIVNMALTLF